MRNSLTKRIKNTEANMKISGYSYYNIDENVFPSYEIKDSKN